jgi:PTH1 family peptidyl-tRNA hydrolase
LSSGIQLIVGLGNPGKEYAQTRHNAGEWWVEMLAQLDRMPLKKENKFHGRHTVVKLHENSVHLLIPTTFMNLSGQAVSACMKYHKIAPESVLVAYDEIDLPTGTVKLKFDGGDAGHNGIRDIIRHLNTRQFYRLRIGVDHPGNSKDVADYVLASPSKTDRHKIDDALQRAVDVLPLLLIGKFQAAMHQLHSEKDNGS